MKRTWKKLFAFVCAFTLVATPATFNGDSMWSGADGTIVSAAENSTDYTITIPATLSVANAGWNATDGIKAKVKSGDTFDTSKKLTVTAESANNWALKSGENSVGYNLATASATYDASATPASWEFSAGELNAENGTNKAMGIIVEDYSNKAAGTYQDVVTFTASVEGAAYIPVTITSLSDVEVLHVGDTINSDSNYTISGAGSILNKNFTWTLVRGSIEGRNFTESDDGGYYVFKQVSKSDSTNIKYWFNIARETGELDEREIGKKVFIATATSDGLTVTNDGSQWSFSVHEP